MRSLKSAEPGVPDKPGPHSAALSSQHPPSAAPPPLQPLSTAPAARPSSKRALGLRRTEIAPGSCCCWNQPSFHSRTHWSDTWKTCGQAHEGSGQAAVAAEGGGHAA